MHNAMEKKKKKGYASLVITNVKALEDGAGEDMDLCNPDEVILASDLLETTTSSEGLRVGTAALERGDGASVKSADQEQLTDAGTITNSIKLEKCDDGRQCKGRFHQRLWFYLFENMNRAIDELYFLCELESDLNQMKEVLLILDEAGVEFKDLQMRVDAFDRITKASCLPQYPVISAPVTSSSSSSSISTNDQNCCRPANAWEVQRMTATSQYHANTLSSSLEALKKPQRSGPQVHRLQGLKGIDSSSIACANLLCNPNSKHPSSVFKVFLAPLNADRRHFDSIGFNNTEDVAAAGSELVTYRRTSSARVSPQRKEAWQKKGGGCIKDEMLIINKNTTTNNSVAGKRRATSSASQIEIGFMRPTASSGQRVASREREQNLVGSKSHSMEAWKLDKRNSELAAAIIISTSDCPPPLTIAAAAEGSLESVGCSGRKRTECVCLLHDKLMSPERKKKTSPIETKNKQSEDKEAAQSVMSQLHKELHEMDRVLFLQQTTEKLSCVSKWQAV
ncbi:unnamed protein product [Sphagnum jensenii]|uniref:S phase cyclin A-associated protein in the endoplasmic reticulum N-terminal domain-containing protein n=1 Tax=Sphagnum jensenii TaxID=128206 RepID=A0ABP1C1E0_9BRYO